MPDEQVRIDIVADDKASKVIDKVADAAGDLEKTEPTVEVKADTDDALHGLADVKGEAKELAGSDATITAKLTNETTGPFADIFADLDRLQTEAKQTGDKLDSVTGGDDNRARLTARGNAISDLTGPLGDVSSQASDVAGVFDGFSDILEGLGPKFGVSAEQMVGAIGGIGFAVTAAVTAWGYFTQKQEEAKKHAAELLTAQEKINDALEEGQFRKAAQELIDAYDDAYTAAHNLGITSAELTDALTGQSDITARLAEAHTALTAGLDASSAAGVIAESDYRMYSATILEAIGNVDTANQSLKGNADTLDQVSDALQGARTDTDDVAAAEKKLEEQTKRTSEAFDRLRGSVNLDQEMLRVQESIGTAMTNAQSGVSMTADEVLDLKSDIITLAETAKANPAEVKSTLDKIDRGDLAGVKADAENYYAHAPVEVTGKLTITNLVDAAKKAAAAMFPSAGGTSAGVSSAPVSVVNVTQHLPRGWRGDALTEARKAAHRSGGLFNRVRR